jgi:hypothetical protein
MGISDGVCAYAWSMCVWMRERDTVPLYRDPVLGGHCYFMREGERSMMNDGGRLTPPLTTHLHPGDRLHSRHKCGNWSIILLLRVKSISVSFFFSLQCWEKQQIPVDTSLVQTCILLYCTILCKILSTGCVRCGETCRVWCVCVFLNWLFKYTIYKSTHLQMSGFSYFSYNRCWQVYKIEHTAMQSP